MPEQDAGPRVSVTDWRRHVPNALTVLRVLLAGGVFAILAWWRAAPTGLDAWLLAAAGLFVLATITDALDGYWARKWSVVSAFGRVMDPFADKILVLGTLILMAGPAFSAMVPASADAGAAMVAAAMAGFTPIMVVLMLGRELLVTSIRAVAEGRGVQFPADWWGKIKMIVQSVAIPLVLVLLASMPDVRVARADVTASGAIVMTAIQLIAILTTAVTVLSAWPYVTRGVRVLRASPGSAT
jgi:CDP-diacylglycerol--glycerol-3-phosphate 3-phosphatidyltransferase